MVPRQGKAFQRRLVSTGPSIDSRRFALASRFTCKSQYFCGALGRTRTCDLLIRSHSPSGTQADTEGQGETKQRFYQVLALLERQGGTGRDTQLRSDCGQNVEPHRRVLEPEAAEGFEVVCREARPQDASGGILAAISHVRMLACGSLRASGR